MDSRGQASAEYLLLIVVLLLAIGLITVPLIGNSISATMNVSTTSDASNAISSISNAVDVVYANGVGAKRTVEVFIPNNLDFRTGAAGKSGFLNMSLDVPVNGTNKSVFRGTDFPVSSRSGALSSGWYQVVVYWNSSTSSYITLTFTKK